MKISPSQTNPTASIDNTLYLKIGTVGGTLLSMTTNIASVDILRSIILAMIGATVSFFVTLLLKWLTKSEEK